MIKVTVTQEEEKSEFPKLMKSTTNGCIVLFATRCQGTCVDSGDSSDRIGEFCGMWDGNAFINFTGSVTLTTDKG